MRELNSMDLDNCVRRLPKQLRTLLREQGNRLFVAGGFIRAVIAGEQVSDIDVMSANKKCADASTDLLAEAMGKPSVHESDNAYTLRVRPVPIQFIHRWTFATPEDGIASFDFTIAKAAIWYERKPGVYPDMGDWHSICADTYYDDLAAKRLVYTSPVRIEEAGGSLLRVLKFYQRGYRIPLSSLSAVIARLVKSLEFDVPVHELPECRTSEIIAALLRDVDPRTPIDEDTEAQEDANG